ncbi:membrane protein [Erysipelotrichaceae bacterium]|nr:membrane protein [Erysipelotrichaceae bacterium]
MTITKNVFTVGIALLLNILLFVCGVVLLVNPNIGIGFIRYYLAFFAGIRSIGAIASFLFIRNNEKKHLLVEGVGLLIIALILCLSYSISTISLRVVLIFVLVLDGILKTITAYQYKNGKMENWYYPLLLGVISLGFAIAIFYTPNQAVKTIIQIIAGYICFVALSDSYDVIVGGEKLGQVKKRMKINFLFIRKDLLTKSSLPAKWMKNIHMTLDDDAELTSFLSKEKIEKKVAMDGYEILKIHIHSWDGDIITMRGHSDFAFDGTVYSFGNYDPQSHHFGGAWSDGCLVIADEQPYIDYCLTVEKKILIEYTLRINMEQKQKLTIFFQKMAKDSIAWEPSLVKGSQDAALELEQAIHAKFYKFEHNQFQYYFALGTNCVRFVEAMLDAIGFEDTGIHGILTPGDYIAFFEKKAEDPENLEVIGRKVLANQNALKS